MGLRRFPTPYDVRRQDHYDYGLRNLKAVLNMAGALKRADPNTNEEGILMRALRCAWWIFARDSEVCIRHHEGTMRLLTFQERNICSNVKYSFNELNLKLYQSVYGMISHFTLGTCRNWPAFFSRAFLCVPPP